MITSLRTAMAIRKIVLTVVVIVIMMSSPTVARAQLDVLMSGGFSGAYERLLPEFEKTSGVKVTTRSGASQGSGPQTIAAQLARGVPADVVILSREGLTELIAAHKIIGGTDVNLAQVPLGIAVREKAPKPDVSTVAAFKQTMTGAKKIALPGSTSGIWLKNDLFPRLGIADKISSEMKPRGTDVTNMVAQERRTSGCCRSVKSWWRRALTLPAPFLPRFSWSRCLRPPSWRTRRKARLRND